MSNDARRVCVADSRAANDPSLPTSPRRRDNRNNRRFSSLAPSDLPLDRGNPNRKTAPHRRVSSPP